MTQTVQSKKRNQLVALQQNLKLAKKKLFAYNILLNYWKKNMGQNQLAVLSVLYCF